MGLKQNYRMKLNMDDIGEVTFLKKGRVKNLRITVKPFEGIQVSFPATVSYNSAISFVTSKKAWIKKSIDRIKDIESKSLIYDENADFKTKYHELKITAHNKSDFRVARKNGICSIFYPSVYNVKDKNVQDTIKSGIIWLLRHEATSYLPFRTHYLAEKHNLSCNRIFVKNLKSRWGSCSHNNNINLNIHLMRLPDHLIDYVILHELAHTVHKNHSKDFWGFLNSMCGDSRKLRNEIRNYSTAL